MLASEGELLADDEVDMAGLSDLLDRDEIESQRKAISKAPSKDEFWLDTELSQARLSVAVRR